MKIEIETIATKKKRDSHPIQFKWAENTLWSRTVYNSRDFLRVLGVPQILEGDKRNEMAETTMARNVDISREIWADVDIGDISITNRLPSSSTRGKRIIVRFARRIAKFNILRSKKILSSKDTLKNVSIFEDLSLPRVKFIRLIEEDTRIAAIWTK